MEVKYTLVSIYLSVGLYVAFREAEHANPLDADSHWHGEERDLRLISSVNLPVSGTSASYSFDSSDYSLADWKIENRTTHP